MLRGRLFLLCVLLLVLCVLLSFWGSLSGVHPALFAGLTIVPAAACALLALLERRATARLLEYLAHCAQSLHEEGEAERPPLKALPSVANLPLTRELLALDEFLRAREEKLRAQDAHLSEEELELAKNKEEKARIEERLNQAKEQQHNLADKTSVVCAALAQDLRGLSRMVAEVGEGAETQRFRLNDTSEAMERIAGSVEDVTRSVRIASQHAEESRSKAQVGAERLREAVNDIEHVKGVTLSLREAMGLMDERTSNISRVMGVISEVADQTNLLALNAAIEAARAGEAGRGFAVVADEVRKLAEKTMQATSEVHQVVGDIQETAGSNKQAVGEAADVIVRSSEHASLAGESMAQIVADMDATAVQFSSIGQAVEEQTASSANTNEALELISGVAADTADQMQHFTAELVRINENMEALEDVIHALRTGDNKSGPNRRLMEWTPDLNTGIALIDDQHKMLCAYINTLYRSVQDGTVEEMGLEIIINLKSYTVSHFNTEEHYFSRSMYPETDKHREMHKHFVAKVAEAEERARSSNFQVAGELLEFLKNWLLNHIRVTDHQYVPFVKAFMEKNLGERKTGDKTHTGSRPAKTPAKGTGES